MADLPLSACVLVVHRDGRVLVVERPERDGSLALPGGKAEPGEDARAAAGRELFEETGLPADPDRLLPVHTDLVKGKRDFVCTLFVYFGHDLSEVPLTPRSGETPASWVSLERLQEKTPSPFWAFYSTAGLFGSDCDKTAGLRLEVERLTAEVECLHAQVEQAQAAKDEADQRVLQVIAETNKAVEQAREHALTNILGDLGLKDLKTRAAERVRAFLARAAKGGA